MLTKPEMVSITIMEEYNIINSDEFQEWKLSLPHLIIYKYLSEEIKHTILDQTASL